MVSVGGDVADELQLQIRTRRKSELWIHAAAVEKVMELRFLNFNFFKIMPFPLISKPLNAVKRFNNPA